MLTLHSECHFWTIRDEVRIKSTDFGAFRYIRQRELVQQHQQPPTPIQPNQHHHQQQQLQQQQLQQHQQFQELTAAAKRDYTERRDGIAVLKKKKNFSNRKSHGRLKDNIKRLEELLRTQKIAFTQWKDASQVLLLFANGIITHISIDIFTGDILRMVYEKYLVGKLAAEVITDAFFTRSHIVLAYNTNQLTVVHLQKPTARPQGPEKIANMDPRIFHVIIPGPSERKLSRHLTVNGSYDLFVIWTKSSQNEVYPWRPTIRDQDRANIHVFKLKGMQLESLAYCWSENDPLCVDFLRSSESQLLTVEQKVSRKGEMSAEICSYEIQSGKMQRNSLTSISVGTQICSYAFSPDQEKLFLGSIDRNVCLHDLVQQTTKFVAQIEIIPNHCTWHCDSSVILIANDRSQFQCFDLALNPIANQLQSEDLTPLNLLDLSHYFSVQPTLLHVSLSRKPDLSSSSQTYAQTDCFLLMVYENGPVACLRFFAGAGTRGDIHNSGLTADVLVDKYLALNQLEKAVNLLIALNWETYGAMCLISLHKIANYVFFRSEPRRTRIELMSKALKTFTESLSDETKDEFGDQVFDLKRRFFFFLIRKNLYAEAFEVAEDIEDYDLFMDLYNLLKVDPNLSEYSTAALNQAATILHEEDRANGNYSLAPDFRSESALSQSTCSELTTTTTKTVHPLKNYVPPLPSFKSKVFSAEMIKINIPKPELRITANMDTSSPAERHRPPAPLPPLPDMTKTIKRTHQAPTLTTTTTISSLSTLTIKTTTDATSGFAPPPTLKWHAAQTEQNVGVPTVKYDESNNTLLPRAHNQHQMNLHYATPIKVNDHHHNHTRMYQQNPALISAYQPKFYQHPLVSGRIPHTRSGVALANSPTMLTISNEDIQKRLLSKKPTASILSNSGLNGNAAILNQNQYGPANGTGCLQTNGNGNVGGKAPAGEKNKVKFSDTVQVAVVPEIPRKEKQMPLKRNGYVRPGSRFSTNPRKELADSLPLCHPNDDYLKDFNPISSDDTPIRHYGKPLSTKDSEQSTTTTAKANPPGAPSIKVVHFGVV